MTTEPAVTDKEETPETLELPVLPRWDTVVYPGVIAQLLVRSERSLRALEHAMAHDRQIVVVSRKNAPPEEVTLKTLYRIGTVATVGRLLRMPDGFTQVWLQGDRRVRVLSLRRRGSFLAVNTKPIQEKEQQAQEVGIEARMRETLALFEKCSNLSEQVPQEAYIMAMNASGPGHLADLIASSLNLSLQQRQEVLEVLDPLTRLDRVTALVAKELDLLELQSKIHTQVQEEVDRSQREYFLREQLRAIQKELGQVDPLTRAANELRERADKAGMPEAVLEKVQEELDRLAGMPPGNPEVTVARNYLDWLVNLPWSTQTEDQLNISDAAKILDKNHHGLRKVKERILEYMAVRKLAQDRLRSPILCFVGPPGVGKTSLGKSIAEALGRKFVRVSLGGIRDEAEIRGHRRTYIGALPGRIIQTMRTAGTSNPVFMLDEIDKVGTDFRGDPSSALLEVLDPEQNHAFSDHFLEVPYDLSKVLFVTTANVLDPILPALRDRMEVIELPGYTEEEKLEIAKRFIVTRQVKEHGLTEEQLRFSPKAIRRLIREYTREAGVRNLERELGSICRKVAKRVAEGQSTPST
ncbi:MAG: endopeptidase La, partial [Chloroflexi bacterium]|nr:endopeptidase La [Chloroflexota bacterium]